MRRPRTPPSFDALLAEPRRLAQHIPSALRETFDRKEYPHWDDLAPRSGEDPSTEASLQGSAWSARKLSRLVGQRELPLRDRDGRPFRFGTPEVLLRRLFEIDRELRVPIGSPDSFVPTPRPGRFLTRALVEEAVRSCQLEGAATTARAARDMLRSRREPRTRGERMIHNQFGVLEELPESAGQPLTPGLVLSLQRRLTEGTLADPESGGRLRNEKEAVQVLDPVSGDLLHDPPSASELQGRLAALCEFANGEGSEGFLHPILRSILLHFWLAEDQPFVEANCRTARVLFYRSMLQQGYASVPYLSLSQILKRNPPRYARAFLCASTDDNDTTYFACFHTDALLQALGTARSAVEEDDAGVKECADRLPDSSRFNPRQLSLLARALHPGGWSTTIRAHQSTHRVTYQTARTDLLGLLDLGLLRMEKAGRTMVFRPRKDLREHLATLG